SDDDMHLAADARVAEQFLYIHQTATAAVDFVLTAAVAEHPASDRHLGVLDRQRIVGVVDRDGDLGAAQRRPRRCACKDDVFHLAAAQGLGALLAHHPGERVDHVRFAGTVGSDDTGNARFEAQSRRRGKGLEALQRQTLEVHDGPHYSREGYRSVKPAIASPTSDQSATTFSTRPGVLPLSSRSSRRWQASRDPCATT